MEAEEDRRVMALRIAARILVGLLWLATFLVAVGWALGWPLPFRPDPVVLILSLVSAAVTAVVGMLAAMLHQRNEALQQERYSTPFALAYGYVNNFVEPVLTRLLSLKKPGEPLHFYIYIPEELAELYPKAIERTLARLKERRYHDEVINLEFKEGRARDIMTVVRDSDSSVRYFDFPNTLLTLVSLIDYKVESHRDHFDEDEKRQLGKLYIDKFRQEVAKLVEMKGLAAYVHFTGKELAFLEDGNGKGPDALP
jgi:hypothetical protein